MGRIITAARITGGTGVDLFPSFGVSGIADIWDPYQGVKVVTGVSSWQSVAGTRNTIAQATGSAQPAYTSSYLNGRPAITFTAAASQRLTGTFARAGARTVFIVGKWNHASAAGAIWDGAVANENRMYRSAATTLTGLGDGGAFNATSINTVANHVHCFVHNGASSSYQQESGSIQTGNSGTPACTGVTIGDLGNGGALPADCSIAYAIDVAGALSAADRALVITVLQAAFGL